MNIELYKWTDRVQQELFEQLSLLQIDLETLEQQNFARHSGFQCLYQRFKANLFKMVVTQVNVFQTDCFFDAICDLNHGKVTNTGLDQSQMLNCYVLG